MKKLILLLFIIFAVLLVSGCRSGTETFLSPSPTVQPPSTPGLPQTDESYTGSLTLEIASPYDGKETTWGFTSVAGTVWPPDAVVEIENEGYPRIEPGGLFFWHRIWLDEGLNEIRVKAIRGNETVRETVTVNYTPDLRVSVHPGYAPGTQYITEYPAVINGLASDPRAELWVDSHQVQLLDGGFTLELPLKPGMNNLDIEARLGDTYIEDTMEVEYRPRETLKLKNFNLRAGQGTRIDYIRVTGHVNYPGADVILMSEPWDEPDIEKGVYCHYATAVVEGDGSFSGWVRLSSGKNDVSATARLGNDRSFASATVSYDPPLINLSSTPDISIASPEPGSVFQQSAVTVTGTVDEDDAVVLVAGMEADTGKDGSFTAVIELFPGENIVEVVAFNGSKKDVEEITVFYEPPLEVTLGASAEPFADYTREPLLVTGSVNKPDAVLTVNGERVTAGKNGRFAVLFMPAAGEGSIEASAVSGNETDTASIRYRLENGALAILSEDRPLRS